MPPRSCATGRRAGSATRAVAEAAPANGVVAGPLYLVGGGDPTLSAARITELAAAVKAAGVTTVQGGVLGDDSAFDHRIGSPDSNFRYDRELGGLLTGLAVNRGWDSKGLQDAPAASAARRFARALKLAGVAVSGDVEAGTAPASAVDVAQIQSAPLSAIVAAMNGPSDNYLAEMLLKRLGAAHGAGGTTAAGAAAAAAALDDIGVRPRIVDGSGLSRSDRTTPRQVVRLLQRVANMEFAQPFTASLPVAGVSGTLQRRMRGTAAAGNCRAKTGTLRYTSNLAGYCTTGDGGVVAFALLMNGVNVGSAHGVQDRIATALARLGRHRRRSGRGTAERARAAGPGDRGRRRGGSAGGLAPGLDLGPAGEQAVAGLADADPDDVAPVGQLAAAQHREAVAVDDRLLGAQLHATGAQVVDRGDVRVTAADDGRRRRRCRLIDLRALEVVGDERCDGLAVEVLEGAAEGRDVERGVGGGGHGAHPGAGASRHRLAPVAAPSG